MKTNYFVHYVENCCPLLKKFKSLKELNAFKKNLGYSEDCYIDFIVKGEMVEVAPYYKELL